MFLFTALFCGVCFLTTPSSFFFFFSITNYQPSEAWVGSACLFLRLTAHRASLRNGPNPNCTAHLNASDTLKTGTITSVSWSQQCPVPYCTPTEAEL